MTVTQRERGAETQAEGEAGSMHREPDVGFDPGSPGSRPGPKAGAKPLRHPGIPLGGFNKNKCQLPFRWHLSCFNSSVGVFDAPGLRAGIICNPPLSCPDALRKTHLGA